MRSFRFPAITLPLFGVLDSFNLLPLLMGVAFYLQQKLTPDPGVRRPAGRPAAENYDDYDAHFVPADALQGAIGFESLYYGKHVRGRY